MNIQEKKNWGLGIINWKTGQNFYFHNGWWHGNTSSFITTKESNNNSFLINLPKTYQVRKLSKLFILLNWQTTKRGIIFAIDKMFK
jgi:hypothetical protein